MSSEIKKLVRSRHDRMIGGVCAGLGEFLGIDPTLVRLIFVLGVVFGFGSFLFIYLVMLLVVPEDSSGVTPIVTESLSASVSPESDPAGGSEPPADA